MEADDINVKELEGKKDKIRELMSRDPKFIARLITVSLLNQDLYMQLLAANWQQCRHHAPTMLSTLVLL